MLGVALGSALPAPLEAEEKAMVVVIRHKDVLAQDGAVRPEILQAMLDEAMRSLPGEPDALSPWHRLFRKSDVVGDRKSVV